MEATNLIKTDRTLTHDTLITDKQTIPMDW